MNNSTWNWEDVIMEGRKQKGDSFDEWMQIFPVLQSINSYHDLPDRDTMLYLCLIGPSRYFFFQAFSPFVDLQNYMVLQT